MIKVDRICQTVKIKKSTTFNDKLRNLLSSLMNKLIFQGFAIFFVQYEELFGVNVFNECHKLNSKNAVLQKKKFRVG